MEEKKTTYPNEATDKQVNAELMEAADLFLRLSAETQDAILELLHSLLDEE